MGAHRVGRGPFQDLRDLVLLMLQTLARIAWMADVAMRQLGDTGSFATAEDWMLPEA